MRQRLRPTAFISTATALLITSLAVVGADISPCWASLPHAPAEGLEHYWALNEDAGYTAADSAGAQTGTLANGPIWQPLAGRFGGAIDLDGVDDRIDLGVFNLPYGSTMSIALWMKADDFDVSDARLISKATGTANTDHYWMISTINSTAIRFRLKAGGSTTTLSTSVGQVVANEWHHVAVTYDGSNMRIYVDGLPAASVPKTGLLTSSATAAVAIGNQPAGAGSRPFDGLIDDVRVYDRALTSAEIAAMSLPKPPPAITLWYGDVLDVGHLGTPQQWVNVVGNVSPVAQVDSLRYTLNGGAPRELSVGPDGFRLVSPGDFNAELDYDELMPGANEVVITVVNHQGASRDTTVTVNYTPGVSWALPDTLPFESVSRIVDAAYVVDGEWELTPDGVRVSSGSMGYDRLLVAGQRHWGSDFEVLAPITIHDFETTFPDNGPAIGIGLGWTGHDGSGQPLFGHPYQSIGFIRGLHSSPYLQLMRDGDVGVATTPIAISLGTRYLMRIRSEAVTITTSHVYLRVWEDGTPEPGTWNLDAFFVTRGGSILLIAHRAEVTFGDTIIQLIGTPVAVGDTPPSARLSVLQNSPNPFGGATTIPVGVAAPTTVDLEVFDVRGRSVYRRSVAVPAAGVHALDFDAIDANGRALPSGVYFYRVTALGEVVTRKMVISR